MNLDLFTKAFKKIPRTTKSGRGLGCNREGGRGGEREAANDLSLDSSFTLVCTIK